MKTIKITSFSEIPGNFTGIAVYTNGSKEWYKKGKHHREDGPAIEESNGSKEWWFKGKCHRLDGPAVEEVNGEKQWFKEGLFHRTDGPALECSDGTKYWYLEDKEYTKISLKDFVVLDSYRGEYGIVWHKLLTKDNIIEFPDIPGLIIK